MSIYAAAYPRNALAILLLGSVSALLAALAFQFIGGLQPCELCVWQRYAHGSTIGLAVMGTAATLLGRQGNRLAVVLLTLSALTLVGGAAIGGFHVGVEQKWWTGTAACSVNLNAAVDTEDLRQRLLAVKPALCGEIAWSLFGISMAGWNAILSFLLGTFGMIAAWALAKAKVSLEKAAEIIGIPVSMVVSYRAAAGDLPIELTEGAMRMRLCDVLVFRAAEKTGRRLMRLLAEERDGRARRRQ